MGILDTNIRSVNHQVNDDMLQGHSQAINQLFRYTGTLKLNVRNAPGDEYFAYTNVMPLRCIRGSYPLCKRQYKGAGYCGTELTYQPGANSSILVVWIDQLQSLYLDSLTICGYEHIVVLDSNVKMYYYKPCGNVTVWELLSEMEQIKNEEEYYARINPGYQTSIYHGNIGGID